MKAFRNQSAMEYLMTYGWAIIIVAIVLGALFSLGVFNAANFMPKAPPGSCHVFRPNGAGTTTSLNLMGTCSELPQFVAQFYQTTALNQSIKTPLIFPQSNKNFSVSLWIYDVGMTPNIYSDCIINSLAGCNGNNQVSYGFMYANSKSLWYSLHLTPFGTYGWTSAGYTLQAKTWYYLTITWDKSYFKSYVNGVLVMTSSNLTGNTIDPSNSFLEFGDLNGSMSNVQLYNASLSANQIQYLYKEGIGGAPINLQNLVGWWPLNGDPNDYSGNNNNAQIMGSVSFTGTWTNGYTVP